MTADQGQSLSLLLTPAACIVVLGCVCVHVCVLGGKGARLCSSLLVAAARCTDYSSVGCMWRGWIALPRHLEEIDFDFHSSLGFLCSLTVC